MPILSVFSSAIPSRSRAFATTLAFAFGLTMAGMVAPAAANTLEEASQSFKSGQHAKALEQINRFLNTKPKDPQGRFLKGIILTNTGKTAEAITIFQRLTEDYPDLPEPYNNLAVIYAQQKQYDKAKDALEKAIRTHPAYATAHENLGDIYARLASQAYGKALQIDGTNASAQTKLAMIDDLVGSSGTKVGAGATVAAAAPAPVTSTAAAKPPTPTPAAAIPAPIPVAQPQPTVIASADSTKKAAATESGSADLNAEITTAVDGWLAAWSKKDVQGYLAYYARDFQVPGGQSRKAWETERSQRIGKPGKIEINRDRLSIQADGADKASVKFRQHYKSPGFNSSTSKTLILVKRDGKWLIQQERAG